MRIAPTSTVNYGQRTKNNNPPKFGFTTRNLQDVIEGQAETELIKGFIKDAEGSVLDKPLISLHSVLGSVLEFKSKSGKTIAFINAVSKEEPDQIHVRELNGDLIAISQSKENDSVFHELRSALFSKVPESIAERVFL